MYNLALIILQPLEWFARAGGGGSSSGGGSSGGGGSSSGGIEALIGYIPMHFVGAMLARVSKHNPVLKVALSVVGWIIAIIYAVFWVYAWYFIGWLIGAAALVGMAAGLYGWFGKIRQSPAVRNILNRAASQDSAWDETKLLERAKTVFMAYQKDWSSRNSAAMKAYTTDRYFAHTSLLVAILTEMKRKDLVQDPVITAATIVAANDTDDNTRDQFTVGFSARATDQLVEDAGDTLFTDTTPFTEYWTFRRQGDTWLLDVISQSTANPYADNNQLRTLAEQRGYFYSEDMGWLFIPKCGQLFGGAKFGTSDINNHIVGLYNNQLLVQLYSYVKDPANKTKPYVIAQVSVPREYGEIVVRRKKLLQFGIHGLERVETEWTRFNEKYEVFASSAEQATSFELLNPTYMEQLEALPFEVNIEVVDNVVYLYTEERGTDAMTYEAMLDLLEKAFKEMRL